MNSIDSGNNKKRAWWSRAYSAVTRYLAHPWLILFLVILALLLNIQSLWTGLWFDDFSHRMFMLDLTPFGSRAWKIFSAYNFIDTNPATNRFLMEIGLLPWWTPLDFRLSFLRPLSSMSIWLDYQLWPDMPVLMHLHSLAWYGALVAAVAWFYRRIMSATWVAGLAALFFAIDSRHTIPATWIANRHALISILFGVLCLIAYDAWRTSGKKLYAVLPPLCFALGLFSGEMALATAGFLLAYALFLDQGRLKKRLLPLLPCFMVLFIWAMFYVLNDFGTHGSGMYIHPAENPISFIKAVIEHAPFLLIGQWTPVPASVGSLMPPALAITTGLLFTAFLVLILFPLLKHDHTARFWFTGMMLSILPVAGADPTTRVLPYIGVAAMPLIARFLAGLTESASYYPKMRFWRVCAMTAAVIFILTHLIIAPLNIHNEINGMNMVSNFYTAPIKTFPDDTALKKQSLILVNPPDYHFSAGQSFIYKIVEGKPYPKRIRALAGCPGPIEIKRLDDRTLRVRTPEGLFKGFSGRVFFSKENPPKAGQEFKLPDVSMHIDNAGKEDGPAEVTYRFTVPLEDPSLRWLQLEDNTYVPFVMPAIGKTVMFHGKDLMDLFFPKDEKKKDGDKAR